MRTLPECNVRKIAYSTFTIIKIRQQRYVELTRFDNPHTVVLQNGKNYDFKFQTRMIEGKKIYESRFEAQRKRRVRRHERRRDLRGTSAANTPSDGDARTSFDTWKSITPGR